MTSDDVLAGEGEEVSLLSTVRPFCWMTPLCMVVGVDDIGTMVGVELAQRDDGSAEVITDGVFELLPGRPRHLAVWSISEFCLRKARPHLSQL